ncbi:MAG: YdeI/OmpD-associated family protein [Gemmatimonadetes bacterium]|nr:YdeI/OmpD-associated family protein [Gemmatimonadota bacterium]
MGTKDKRIDAYIAKSQPFARPILAHLRDVVHAASPSIVEDMKWGMPFFVQDGRILCHMAAFKAHAAFGIWDAARVMNAGTLNREAMGSFGRITNVKDLPAKRTLVGHLKRAIALVATSPAAERRARTPKPVPRLPAELSRALKADAALRTQWSALAPGYRREYVEWIAGAKRPETRARRLATTVAQVRERKGPNWRYAAKRRG